MDSESSERPKAPDLTHNNCVRIDTLRNEGYTYKQISQRLKSTTQQV